MSSNCSRCKDFSKDLICSIMMKLICEISCSELLKWMANSQVLLFFSMFDLWLRNLTLNSVEVEPTYCRLHLAQVAK